MNCERVIFIICEDNVRCYRDALLINMDTRRLFPFFRVARTANIYSYQRGFKLLPLIPVFKTRTQVEAGIITAGDITLLVDCITEQGSIFIIGIPVPVEAQTVRQL